ncbi:uncharacterized protein PAC_01228 [Phialocephala subalpina]|uniref:Uncharacterized protein n=1 Tax=Phialocephala subalpina TaxID=576137 RepID=A0A1L7WEZ7_9HELO|nr:uncharacterized protein PAC_01228 [Phialocephala subalpina]
MYQPPVGGEMSPEITPSPSYYSDVHPPPTFEQKPVVTRKPVPTKSQYEQVNPVPDGWQGFPEDKGFQWLPGLWTHIPIPGILAIIGALICVAGTIAVLVRSDGMPVTHWTLSPTVYIALMTTGTNMLTRFAFHEGNKISWWYRATRGGTLRDLHTRWESGDGFWGALGAGRNFNLVSLASLAATFIVIDQPLIQRASTIVPATSVGFVNVTASIAPEIPYGYTGYQYGRVVYEQVMTQPMITAFNDFNTQAPITTGFTGCKDQCTGYVNAGGLAAQCTTLTGPVAYLQSPKMDGVDISNNSYIAQSPFSVNFTLVPEEVYKNDTYYSGNSSSILMVVSYTTNASLGNCGGTLVTRTCKLKSATLRYPITLQQLGQNTTVRLGNITAGATIESFQPPGNKTISIDGGSDFDRWTLGGLYLAANSLFQANATYQWIGALGVQMNLLDTLSNQFLVTPTGNNTLYGLGIPASCSSNWTDPTNHIIESLNQIAFRVALNAAQFPFRNTTSPPAPQILMMYETRTINVFQSVYRYLAASTVLTVVCVALVLPTFAGWWELGRSVSLNPLETAKAFDAPLLNGPGSNAPLHELVRTMGMRNVRYGEVEGSANGLPRRELKLADPQELVRPTSGTVYQ